MIKLTKGSVPVCLMSLSFRDFGMDKQFLYDLMSEMKHISQQSIAEDILNGAYDREFLSRVKTDLRCGIDGIRAFSIYSAVGLRYKYDVKPINSHYKWSLSAVEHNRMILLIEKYGMHL